MAENRPTCASCGTTNEEDARFCEGCGGSLARVCATCGVEANATARFCRGCGSPLDGQAAHDRPAAGPVRKTVTVMFADLAGSTSFEEKVDAETAREVIGRYHDLLRSTSERHRAGVTKYIGDGFMGVWGVPEIGPDDAAHAVDAAVELQERFVDLAAQVTETHGVELALRVAVNTGEVVVGAGDADLVGDALNVGARLEAECPRGQVVVGEETWRSTRSQYQFESLGEVQVKGRSAPVSVYQWLGRESDTADAAPFVGRADEIRRLQAVFDDAVGARTARLVTVVGDPGVGKSRLAAEFTGSQGDARVVEARCDVQRTVALAPVVEMLRARDLETDIPASVPERDRLLRDLNGLTTGVPGSVEENFWALRRYIEVLAWGGPVVLVLDDIQWADTLLLDFTEHLVEWVQEVPVLVLALARPELREIRPNLVTVSRWVSAAVHLGGLDAGATAELAANVLGATRLPDELLRRLPASTGGNPLFVRELIGMLAHDGVLVEQPGGWQLTIDVDAIAIPPTIHALLASRLERLDAADRRVLEIASVVGSDFSLGTVRAIAGNAAAGVELSLNRLRGLELAQPSGAYVGDEPVWRFHHVLIRDVAYRRLLKSDRADLHQQLADWVAAGGLSVALDSDEMIARHLEAAHTYRLELGRLDEHTDDLALRSARHYAASARRALDRDELVSAGNQAARGAALANADPAVHAELLLIGCEAFLSAGDVAAGAPLVDELERISDDALEPWATCYRCQFVVYTAPERLLEVDSRLQGAIDEFGRRADPSGLAKAHRVRAGARLRLGRVGDGEVDLFEALIAARQSGDHRQITAALGAAPGAALWGPSPVPKAGGRCLDVVRMQRMTTAAPSLEATSLRHLAVLELLRGRPDKARTMLADARQIVADLGLRHGLMETELFAGIIESMEGDPVAAEPHFRTALEGLDALGVGADAGQAAALLARSVLAQGRIDEADRYATESEHLAGRNLKTAIAWRAVRAEILAAQGRHDDAAAMAREAVAVAAGTDIVLDHAEACLALSRVLAAAGDAKGATGAREDAERLYAAKEVAAAIGRVAEPAAAVAVTPPSAEAIPTASRLAVTNQSCEFVPRFFGAMRAHDVEGALGCYSDQFVYDDRRRISGDPVRGRDAMRAAIARVLEQYTRFEVRVLAVRGQRLHLLWTRLSDDDGNETTTFYVDDTDDDGRIYYHGRFDEDDFEGAYRELERRYYTGEGAAFAEAGTVATESIIALNRGDFDRAFGELSTPEMRFENRSRLPFPDRSTSEMRAGSQDFSTTVASWRTWGSSICWLSPTCGVARLDREVAGADGEQFEWTWLQAFEVRNGRAASLCFFDLEDEDAAFSYAEERVQSSTSRLAVTNRARESVDVSLGAMQAHDVDACVAVFADRFVYDDRRRLSGEPIESIAELRAASERILERYPHVDWRTLAVRGERLELRSTRWRDDAGNEATYLSVCEVGDDGRIEYHGRFDEDDFESAYRELERRYYAGEGAPFAEAGSTATEWMIALNAGDFDRLFGELTAPDMHIENRSQSVFGDPSASELRASFEELNIMVASSRAWTSAGCWVSPTRVVARLEREAVGPDGEKYTWARLHVCNFSNGRLVSDCRFDLEDEETAFAYAEERVRATASRLAVTNQSCEFLPAFIRAAQAHDVDGTAAFYSDRFVYDDRRGLSGDPVVGRAALRVVIERLFDHYTQFEFRVLAVRGQRLHLMWSRWSDDDGNETTSLFVNETDDDGLIYYYGRFDEDDFESAYRELERRYYAGEGSAFAEAGATVTDWVIALNQGDFDRIFGELSIPDLRFEDRSRSGFGDFSAAEFRATFRELNTMVASVRTWISATCWVSPDWFVARLEREAIGRDGEKYTWTRVHVAEIRAGRLVSIRRFETDDEQAAFAYAEERMRATTRRLAVTNRASQSIDVGWQALVSHDVDGAVAVYADLFSCEDRRRMRGHPIDGTDALRRAFELIVEQYPHIEWRTLAVRGQRLELVQSRWSDDAGNETVLLHVFETDVGRIVYDGRFDEDDFEGAYRELEKRYYAGEGAAFAEAGATVTDYAIALTRFEFDRVSGELSDPHFRLENRSRAVFGDRSAAEFLATNEELTALVASARTWNSALCWLSPALVVGRFEREAVGPDGERYAWTGIDVAEVRDGRLASVCLFDLEDEEAAFAYAEERMRATTSRLAVSNRACEVSRAMIAAMRGNDADGAAACFSHDWVYDDRRRLAGNPPDNVQVAIAGILQQYNHFESRTLAVRGDRLHMLWSLWSDDSGNETNHLHVHEVGDDGRIRCEVRFDEDDFEGAYRELELRYYAGEGAPFAEGGSTLTEWAIAVNSGNLGRVIDDLTVPDARIENRSRSVFGDRSAEELRAGIDELNAMVATSRSWFAAVCWLSPAWVMVRAEREAVGHDGEKYAWTRIYVIEIRDGRAASSCQFDLEDEEAAFAYAEERMRATTSRLAVTNRASEILGALMLALEAHDLDIYMAGHSDRFVYDDRRRLSGDPVEGLAAFRTACERFLEQYSHFQWRALAVRGSRLELAWSRWWDDAGNETSYLTVLEVDDDGRIEYHGRFDEDDFDSAYRELERRYYAGEGAPFAEAWPMTTDWVTAVNQGDFDIAFGELSTSEWRAENRSRSAFPDRSAAEVRASLTELNAMVASARTWNSVVRWVSPNWVVARQEREAVGHDGEHYVWVRLVVGELRDGRNASACEFDIEDEEAAFAYAEGRMRATTSRLAVINQASQKADELNRAMQAGNVDAAVATFSDRYVYDDRRRLSGNPVENITAVRAAIALYVQQYSCFERRSLAVRGTRLNLARSRCSNDAGFESTHLHVYEVGDDGRIEYEGRFDEDDFESAYRELDRRYYTGEGAAFAEAGTLATDWIVTLNQGDFDRLFGELTDPEMRVEHRSRSAFSDGSSSEFRASIEELSAMTAWSRTWNSAICWLSPTCCVARNEREALGQDHELYTWTRLVVVELPDGRVASFCEFEIEDEDAAFAHAEELLRATTSRLAVTNRASQTTDAICVAMRAADVDTAIGHYADQFVHDDHRRLSGDPVRGVAAMRAAAERVLEQYTQFDTSTLAIRGERLHLFRNRWLNDAGYETTYLFLYEVGDDGHIVYEGRFDEDDFERAYRELDRRYYAGEGAAFAEAGTLAADWIVTLNQGYFDRLFGELSDPEMRVENRSSSAFGDRSAAEVRATFEELHAMVASVRSWHSTVRWLSPSLVVVRFEREAIGRDGERYTWTHIDVCEFRGGRFVFACHFDPEDEEAAFAYAEERVRAATSRLPMTNRASDTAYNFAAAMRAHDLDGVMAFFSDGFVFDDRRRLIGAPLDDLRMAMSRILDQYNMFEWRTLAVRGERLHLFWSKWSDDAGNETSYLFVREVGDDGRIEYEGRFDEDDFEGAYRELDRRYYAGEGAAFAEAGAVQTEWLTALNRGDIDRLFGELSSPEIRFEIRSSSAFPDHSAAEARAAIEELNAMVASVRTWHSAVCWVSPTCCVGRNVREAVGPDGEQYAWTRLGMIEIHDGRATAVWEFEDEEAAFAYADERMRATPSRLAVTNRAKQTWDAANRAVKIHDVDALAGCYADGFEIRERRLLGEHPPDDDVRIATDRILAQYPRFEASTVAVRGERLHLGRSRWINEAGYETTYLMVHEVGDDGRFIFEGRFDEDDFEGAYRELDRRYYAGEGAAIAEAGAVGTELVIAMSKGDFDRMFGELVAPDLYVENRSRSVFGDRSAAEFRSTLEELDAMVASARSWHSAACCLSPTLVVCRYERDAVGQDGERYAWAYIQVIEVRNGRLTSLCQFELDDEDAAFAYAEERVRATASRLAVRNGASQSWDAVGRAMEAHDADAAVACYAEEQFVYDDQRRLSGNPIPDLRTANARIMQQYSEFEGRTLAVRGERLHLGWSRWSNESGFETAYLYVHEIGDDGRFIYEGRFDEDNFEGAYRELTRRYCAGEGAAFAEGAALAAEWLMAANRGDFDRVFGELTDPGMRLENRSSSAFPNRSATELRSSFEELKTMVASTRLWASTEYWLSPTCCVVILERDAVGRDGERYTWTRIFVCETRDGRCTGLCEFELEDEEAAFAYAQERMRATPSRLAVTNRAKETDDAIVRAWQARDFDAVAACYSPSLVYDDRRRLSGHPIGDMRTAIDRVAEQYTQYEFRSLAVRGDRLHLGWTRWLNDSGFESSALWVHEVDDAGIIVYQCRFDEDDFEAAYHELTRRYCAGEGAAVADVAALGTEWLLALNNRDLDRAFGELTHADARVENRSSSPFPDRSAAELRASFEDLYGMVKSARSWNSAECWLSSTCGVVRHEREAVGNDGEPFAWTRLYVFEARDGRGAGWCEFEPDDEAAAFAYAEERVRRAEQS